jgi:hypothetical protein
MKFVASARLWSLGAILLVVTLVVAAALTGTSRAGSVRASVDVQISPHLLTAGERGLITIKFKNSGPSTVNHVFATVTQAFKDANGNITSIAPLPLPASAFIDPNFSLPTGCLAAAHGEGATDLTCDIGQVAPGISRRVISFRAPAGITPFFVHVSASFDEGKNSGLVDTVPGDDDFPFSLASGTTTRGQCSLLGDTVTASDNTAQTTSLTYRALPASLLPCTPVSAGVLSSVINPNGVLHPFPKISFVDFLDGAGLATVKISFLSPPKGVTKKNLALYELARFPIDQLTATNGGAAVPLCVTGSDGNLQIPVTSPQQFISCIVSVDTLSGGGLIATLLARGGDDGGWGGIG